MQPENVTTLLATILNAVCTEYGVKKEDMYANRGKRLPAVVSVPRQYAVYLMSKAGVRSNAIGQFLHIDGSTARLYAKEVQWEYDKIPEVRERLDRVSQRITNN